MFFSGGLDLAPFWTPLWVFFWHPFWTALGPRWPPKGPRGAQEELPEGVYFWAPFLDHLLTPTWVQMGRGPMFATLTVLECTCSGKTDRKVPKVTMAAFVEKMWTCTL